MDEVGAGGRRGKAGIEGIHRRTSSGGSSHPWGRRLGAGCWFCQSAAGLQLLFPGCSLLLLDEEEEAGAAMIDLAYKLVSHVRQGM